MTNADGPTASDPAPKPARRRAWGVVQVVLGLGLVGWLVGELEIDELAALARQGDPFDLVAGFALLFVAFPLLQSVRLHVLVARYTERLSTTTAIFLIGALFNNLLPSNVGGDAVRVFYLQRLKASGWGGPLALSMLHRLSGVVVLHAAALVCIALRHDAIVAALRTAHVRGGWSVSIVALAVGGLVLLGVTVALLGPIRARWGGFLTRLWTESKAAMLDTDARALGALFVLTLAFHAARALGIMYLLAYANQSAHPYDLVIALAVTAVAALIPLTVGGLGIMEGALGATLVAFGVSEPAAIAVALAHRAVLLVNAAAGGLVYATYGRAHRSGHRT